MQKKSWITDGLILAAIPFVGYFLLYIYYTSMERSYQIPVSFGGIDLYQLTQLSINITVIMILGYAGGELAAKFVFNSKNNPWPLRYQRILQTVVALGFGLYMAFQYINEDASAIKIVVAVLIVVSPIAILLIVREFIYPLVKNRRVKLKTKRLLMQKPNSNYESPFSYHRDLLKGINISFILIPFLLITLIASNAGSAQADHTKPHSYIIVQVEDTKRIVLIDYGPKWLTALYDDSYPGMPAYRREFQVINEDDMGKYKFKVQRLEYLYVYNN